ncbi:MAG: DUF4278 domain-containing protein [Phormidesmis sp.]
MQLTYRGVKYNTTEPTVEIEETQEVAQYRGATYHLHRAITTVVRSTENVLIYRGAIVH